MTYTPLTREQERELDDALALARPRARRPRPSFNVALHVDLPEPTTPQLPAWQPSGQHEMTLVEVILAL